MRRIFSGYRRNQDTPGHSDKPIASLSSVMERLPADSPLLPIARDVAEGKSPRSIQPLIAALMDSSPRAYKTREAAIRILEQAPLTIQECAVANSILGVILSNRPQEALLPRLARAFGWA